MEFNENKKLSKITPMIGDHIVTISWRDTLGHTYSFSTLTVEYQDDFIKYNFKDAHMGARRGYYDAYAIRDEGELGLEIFYNKDDKEIRRKKHKTEHNFSSAKASPEESAQKELSELGISANVTLTTYGHSSDGFLAVDSSKGRRILLVDRKNSRVAEVGPRMSFAEFGAQRGVSSPRPWIVNFTITNDTREGDAAFGVWSGQNHMIPIYMLYTFNGDGTVKPGMLTSGAGANPSHYQGYLKEQKNVDLANLLLTEALTLLDKANAAGISL